jgi:prepilin-type N-terminal cleavage/methylation domain-containing protein
MHTRWNRLIGHARPGLTLPELLAAIVVLGTLGLLFLAHRCSTPPASPPPAASIEVPLIDLPQTSGNLLVNGSFEDDSRRRGRATTSFGRRSLPGWEITRGTVDVLSPEYWEPAPDRGRQSLDLVGTPGEATIQQTFPTVPGRVYRFSGWVAHNPEKRGAVDARALVFLNGRLLTELYHRDPRAHNRAMGWTPFMVHFRAGGRRTTLSIADVSGHGGFWGTALDGLAVTPAARR